MYGSSPPSPPRPRVARPAACARPLRRRVAGALALLGAVLVAVLGAVLGVLGASPARADDAACQNLARDANRILGEAEVLANDGQAEKSKSAALRALEILERALALCAGSRDVSGQAVIAAVYAGDYPRARAWLERHAASTPYGERDPEVHYLRALVALRLTNQPEQAVRGLERMQALAPRLHATVRDNLYYDALLAWGSALTGQGRYEEALRQFRTAAFVARRAERPAKERRARGNAGITLARARRYDEAESVFQQLLAEEPQNPIWAYQLGINLASQFKFQEAASAYRTSLAHQAGWRDIPENLRELARARLRLGNCLRLWGQKGGDPAHRDRLLAEAEQELEAYRAAQPEDALAHLWLGVLRFEEREDWHGAARHFEQALALDPWCESTLRYLIRARQRAGGPAPAASGGPAAADPAAQAAWDAETARLERLLEEQKAQRDEVIKERAARTGDEEGGCK